MVNKPLSEEEFISRWNALKEGGSRALRRTLKKEHRDSRRHFLELPPIPPLEEEDLNQ